MMRRSALNNEQKNKKCIDKGTAYLQETVGEKNAAQHLSKFWPISWFGCNSFTAIGWQCTK